LERNRLILDNEKGELKQDKKVNELMLKINGEFTKIRQNLEKLSKEDKEILNPSEMDENGESVIKFGQKLQHQFNEENKKKTEEELKKAFIDKDFVNKLFEDFETRMVGYDQLYKDAKPDTEVTSKGPTAVEKSLKAIEAAIARTSELRAKAEAINSITSSGMGIIASFIPGGGAVIAAQKVAYDIYVLVKSVEAHNKWCENTKIAYRSSSAYGPAIEKMMTNARIHLSEDSVKIALDSLKLGSEVGRCFDPTGSATIVSASLTITSALVDYGYKMHKEVEIIKGWKAYVKARENPGDRKNARKALRMNSTLAKCCIAYGACIVKDPAAQDAIARCGLNPLTLASDKDVCAKLIDFLENEMSRDPNVLQVDKSPKKWKKGRTELTLLSWLEIKTAAVKSAKLSPGSAKTPAMDKLLFELGKQWKGCPNYGAWLAKYKEENNMGIFIKETKDILEDIYIQMAAYRPQHTDGTDHTDMLDIAKTYQALAKINIMAAERDLKDYPARITPDKKESFIKAEKSVVVNEQTEVVFTALNNDKEPLKDREVVFEVDGEGQIEPETGKTNEDGIVRAKFVTTEFKPSLIRVKINDIELDSVEIVGTQEVNLKNSFLFADKTKGTISAPIGVNIKIGLLDNRKSGVPGKLVTLVVNDKNSKISPSRVGITDKNGFTDFLLKTNMPKSGLVIKALYDGDEKKVIGEHTVTVSN